MNKTFALVDCNNFFVSCERVFAPHLDNKPVVVLSNNDGCAISRSNEAKALGIKMGEPFFKFRKLYDERRLEVFSSNFSLYSNMSWRVMQSLKMLSPKIEVYSVDEAFLDFSEIGYKNIYEQTQNIRIKIKQWTGIPVSIGIAPTKTLAKVANQIAKSNSGVFNLFEIAELDTLLDKIPVEDIWGIGKNLAPKLRMIGIGSAKDLKNSDPSLIRKKFSIVVERIVYELAGISCLELSSIQKAKKSITYSRSFGRDLTSIRELEEVLVVYVSNACEKIRKQNSRALNLNIAIRTNNFNKNSPKYSNSFAFNLPYYSNDTREFIFYGKKLLKEIFKPGYQYHKLTVILSDFQNNEIEQKDLFITPDYNHSDKLMNVIDSLNNTMGKNTIFLASGKNKNHWQSQKKNTSAEYTTNWKDLPIVT